MKTLNFILAIVIYLAILVGEIAWFNNIDLKLKQSFYFYVMIIFIAVSAGTLLPLFKQFELESENAFLKPILQFIGRLTITIAIFYLFYIIIKMVFMKDFESAINTAIITIFGYFGYPIIEKYMKILDKKIESLEPKI